MEAGRNDILIKLKLEGDNEHIDPKYLLQVLESLETSLYSSDRKDIEQVSKEFEEISNVIRDACLERLRQFRHRRLLITEAKTGSIEIIGLVAAVTYYLIDKTVGETLKDTFKESDLNKRIKNYFRQKIDEKSLFITESLRRAFSSKKREVEVKAFPATETEPNTIIVIVKERAEKVFYIKSLGKELD